MVSRLLSIALALFFSCESFVSNETVWRWHATSYGSPSVEAKLFVRSGTARVSLVAGNLDITLTETATGKAEHSSFLGTINGTNVKGVLKGFFPSGDELRRGIYSEKRTANCRWRQFYVFPEYPDGSALVISQITGQCQ